MYSWNPLTEQLAGAGMFLTNHFKSLSRMFPPGVKNTRISLQECEQFSAPVVTLYLSLRCGEQRRHIGICARAALQRFLERCVRHMLNTKLGTWQ